MSPEDSAVEAARRHIDEECDFEVVEVDAVTPVAMGDSYFDENESRFRIYASLSHTQEKIQAMIDAADPSEADEIALFWSEPTKLVLLANAESVIHKQWQNIQVS